MYLKSLLAVIALAGPALAVPAAGKDRPATTIAFAAEDSSGHALYDEINKDAREFGDRRLEKRAAYPVLCPSFTTPGGVTYVMLSNYCSRATSLSAYTCTMIMTNAPGVFQAPMIREVARECDPGFACIAGNNIGLPAGIAQQRSWCATKHVTQPIELPDVGSLVITTAYQNGVTGAARGSTTATVLVADSTLAQGVNISAIRIQPMIKTPIGLYPYGPHVTCADADACSLDSIPPGILQFQTTLTAATAIAGAMMFAMTG